MINLEAFVSTAKAEQAERSKEIEEKRKLNQDPLQEKRNALRAEFGFDVDLATTNRFKLDKNEELLLVVLDKSKDDIYGLAEHSVKVQVEGELYPRDTKVKCFSTDPGVGDKCPLCIAAKRKIPTAKGETVGVSNRVIGLTVLPLIANVDESGNIDGKSIKLRPIFYRNQKTEPVFSKAFWTISSSKDGTKLMSQVAALLAGREKATGTIRGTVFRVKRGGENMSISSGELVPFTMNDDGSQLMVKSVSEDLIQKLAAKLPEPLTEYKMVGQGTTKVKTKIAITSKRVPSHDASWLVKPIACYAEVADLLDLETAKKKYDPDYMFTSTPQVTNDLFEEEEISFDEEVTEVQEKAPVAATPKGSRKKPITKPEIAEDENTFEAEPLVEETTEEDDFDF